MAIQGAIVPSLSTTPDGGITPRYSQTSGGLQSQRTDIVSRPRKQVRRFESKHAV
jgi:hypothetical protein